MFVLPEGGGGSQSIVPVGFSASVRVLYLSAFLARGSIFDILNFFLNATFIYIFEGNAMQISK